MQQAPITLKVSLHSDPTQIRRVRFDPHSPAESRLEELRGILLQLFPVLSEVDHVIRYVDDEGDLVSLSSEIELMTALDIAQNTSNKILRLILGTMNDQDQNTQQQQQQQQTPPQQQQGFFPHPFSFMFGGSPANHHHQPPPPPFPHQPPPPPPFPHQPPPPPPFPHHPPPPPPPFPFMSMFGGTTPCGQKASSCCGGSGESSAGLGFGNMFGSDFSRFCDSGVIQKLKNIAAKLFAQGNPPTAEDLEIIVQHLKNTFPHFFPKPSSKIHPPESLPDVCKDIEQLVRDLSEKPWISQWLPMAMQHLEKAVERLKREGTSAMNCGFDSFMPFFSGFSSVQSESSGMAIFKSDETVPDGTPVEIGSTLLKCWTVKNESAKHWPEGCTLNFLQGSRMGAPESVTVSPIAPEATAFISLTISPSEVGPQRGYFELRLPDGTPFGDRLWIDVVVVEPAQSASAAQQEMQVDSQEDAKPQQHKTESNSFSTPPTEEESKALANLESMGFANHAVNLVVLRLNKGNFQRTVDHLLSQ